MEPMRRRRARAKGVVPPRPAYGHSKDGRDDLKQVLLSLGVSSEGLPLRMGLRDGNTSDSTETPVAIEECLALGLDGVRGIVADSKAYCKRTLGVCLEQRVGLITFSAASVCGAPGGRGVGPATRGVALIARKTWADPSGATAMLVWAKRRPSRARGGRGQAVSTSQRYAFSRRPLEPVGPASGHKAYAAAQAKEAERVAEHIQRVEARWFACAADAEAAISD